MSWGEGVRERRGLGDFDFAIDEVPDGVRGNAEKRLRLVSAPRSGLLLDPDPGNIGDDRSLSVAGEPLVFFGGGEGMCENVL